MATLFDSSSQFSFTNQHESVHLCSCFGFVRRSLNGKKVHPLLFGQGVEKTWSCIWWYSNVRLHCSTRKLLQHCCRRTNQHEWKQRLRNLPDQQQILVPTSKRRNFLQLLQDQLLRSFDRWYFSWCKVRWTCQEATRMEGLVHIQILYQPRICFWLLLGF